MKTFAGRDAGRVGPLHRNDLDFCAHLHLDALPHGFFTQPSGAVLLTLIPLAATGVLGLGAGVAIHELAAVIIALDAFGLGQTFLG